MLPPIPPIMPNFIEIGQTSLQIGRGCQLSLGHKNILLALFTGLVIITLCFFIIPLYCMHVRMPYVSIKELTYLLTYLRTET